jgi:hypothetical protein
LNDCPVKWWDGLDASEIAADRGDSLVLLNGPRHFLMDSAKATTGATQDFGGERLRRVATIPIRTSADLSQAPYTDREIDRTNTWHWRAGRSVYELLAPNGSTYLMQSYSQIVDPGQTMADLSTLGSRLDLPQGWSYRTRRLKDPLTLRASGSATIIQDDLKNTYQRLPPADHARKHRVAMTAATKSVGSSMPGTIEDRGSVAGRPFGAGTIDLFATFQPEQRMTGTFTIDTKRGSAFGTMDTTYAITGDEIDFTGTADITGGTGRYRGIKAKGLVIHDHNTLDGQNGSVTIDGHARF